MKSSKVFKFLFFLFSLSIFIPTFYQKKTFAASKSSKQSRFKAWTEKFKKKKKTPEEIKEEERIKEAKKKAEEEIKLEIIREEEEKKKKQEELKKEMKKRREEEIKKEEERKKEVEDIRQEAKFRVEERERQKIIEEETQRKISEIKTKIYQKYGIEVTIPHKTPVQKQTEEFEAKRAWDALQYSGASVDMKKYDELNLKSLQIEEDLKLAEMKVNSFAPDSKERDDAKREYEQLKKEKQEIENEKERLWNDKIVGRLLKEGEDSSEFIKSAVEWLKKPSEDEKITYRWKQLEVIYKKEEFDANKEATKITKEMNKIQKEIDQIDKELAQITDKDGNIIKGGEGFASQYKWQKRVLEMKLAGASAGWTGSGGDIKKIYDTGKEVERFTKRLERFEFKLRKKKSKGEDTSKIEESITKVKEGLENAKQLNKDLTTDLKTKLKLSKGITGDMEIVVNGRRKDNLLKELGQLKEGDEKIEDVKKQIKDIDEKFPTATAKFKEYEKKQIDSGKSKKQIDEDLQKNDAKLKEVDELVGAMLRNIEEDKKTLKKNQLLLISSGASLGASVLQGILGGMSGYDVEISEAYVEGADVERFAGDFEGGVSEEYGVSEEDLTSEEEEKLERLRLARLARMK